jgi:hypothetical protein
MNNNLLNRLVSDTVEDGDDRRIRLLRSLIENWTRYLVYHTVFPPPYFFGYLEPVVDTKK